ncbi:hypothetical protein A8709_23310 [Paenibacillus pectinilyticus]|uniref:Uncharacterized protein n=1 Tax=Paenibacillus pectinilyticus TaxID=512399 RepID=A0A1C0ZRT7_9BACL|nr:glycoside hydrolase family 95 protein [Paenibacillus pectinilyticus]OCT10764.1 hypothetical protein A8709_23310 [Paenibacillus pectinilyticus]
MKIRKLRKMAATTALFSLVATALLASGVPSISRVSATEAGGTEIPVLKTGNWDDLKFNWTTPASGNDFNGAPVGNGYFGAKVSGGVASEILQLSDKTFHSGEPFNNYVPARQTALNTTRSLLAQADTATTVTYREDKLKAAETAATGMWGSTQLAEFLPIGRIVLDVPNTTGYTDYNRELHLDKSMVTTKYKVGNTTYTREVFASNPDRVMVIRMTNDGGLPMSMTAKMTLPAEMNTHGTVSSSGNEIQMTGTAPYDEYASQWATGRGMTFDARLRVRTTGGTITATGGNLNISGATVIELLYADATSYKDPFTNPNPSQGGNLPTPIVNGIMNAAFAKTYTQLLDAHQTDYRSLFRRLWTEVNGNSGSSRPYTLTYQYARYVSIAASRENTFDRPFNENGMWQKEWRPTSYGAHFFNENVEKMYGLIETGNLSENGDPLWKYIKNLAINGAKTAQSDFGFDGWMVPHASDVWAKTELSAGDNEWAIWPTGGMWLMFNVYDHYRFTHDISFLRNTAFPLMKGSAEFALDLLVTNKDGYLVTSPSTSPEAKYVLSDGTHIAVSQGSTIDMTVIRELFENILEAGNILGANSPSDVDLRGRIQTALPLLLPYQIASNGELKEWNNDYVNSDPSHRHASHLIGVGFLDQITKRDTPTLFDAVKVSLTDRGTGGYHPDSAYMWARLNEGDKAISVADVYPTGQYVNEWQVKGAYYPELFVQSHLDNIDILPALPSSWTTGSFSGIKARGGFEVGVSWSQSRATSIQVKSLDGTRAKLSYLNINGASVVDQSGTPVTYTVVDNNQIEFNTTVGSTYTITAIPPSPTIVKVDDRDASVTYSGTWSTYNHASDYLGTEKYSGTAGDYAQFTFTGTSIKFISMKQPNMGIVDVYVDGVLDQANVDMYAPSAIKQAVVYTKTGLSNASHTIKVVNKGTKNPASSGTYAAVDAFEYVIPVTTTVKVDDQDSSVTYSGAWSTYSGAADYLGTEKYSGAAGAYAQFTFTGTSVKFISMTQPNMGIVDVYIDGVLDQGNIDLYASTVTKQVVAYTKTGLTNASHTIKVVVKGTKNPASSGTYGAVDAFEYTN